MKIFVAAHIRDNETHDLVGIRSGWHEVKEWVYTQEDGESEDSDATLAKLNTFIMNSRRKAGLRTDGCYCHIISISQLPDGKSVL